MEQILNGFVKAAASVLTKWWQAIDADRRSRRQANRRDELSQLSVELTASDEQSETSARFAILDSTQ